MDDLLLSRPNSQPHMQQELPGEVFCSMTLLFFFTKYTMSQYSNTNCFLFQAKSICVPKDYVKFELPPESPTVVYIGIDIKDIPKVRVLNIFLFKFIYAFFLILFPNAKEILLYLIIFHIWAYPTGYFQIYLHFLIVFPSILVSAGV